MSASRPTALANRAPGPPSVQRVGLVLWPGFGLTALAGVIDVLAAASQLIDGALYEPVLLTVEAHQVSAAGGVPVQVRPLGDAPPLDLVLVLSDGPCHPGAGHRAAALLAWLLAQAAAGRPLGGVGTGAAWLAEAGLLRGHRATVDWPHITALAERHEAVVVSRQRYEIDRDRLSCAGQQASRDLMIDWLGRRHGARVAPALAAQLGLSRLRAFDEMQRPPTTVRGPGGSGSAKLSEALSLMEANLAEPLPTEDIARLVGVSRRQLERLFRQHLDALPSRWYLGLRLQRARQMLRQTQQSVLQIGLSCGFASGPHFSNAYRAHFGHTPRDERSAGVQAWQQSSDTPAAVPAGRAFASPAAPERSHQP